MSTRFHRSTDPFKTPPQTPPGARRHTSAIQHRRSPAYLLAKSDTGRLRLHHHTHLGEKEAPRCLTVGQQTGLEAIIQAIVEAHTHGRQVRRKCHCCHHLNATETSGNGPESVRAQKRLPSGGHSPHTRYLECPFRAVTCHWMAHHSKFPTRVIHQPTLVTGSIRACGPRLAPCTARPGSRPPWNHHLNGILSESEQPIAVRIGRETEIADF